MPAKQDRFLLLDVMRAFAVLMMIQGHTADALLIPSYLDRENPIWKIWEFGRGLTAPIFLFGSGFAYVIATISKLKDGKLPGWVYLKRLRWIVLLFVTGSLMHIPAPTLLEMKKMSPALWSIFFQVDILRLMAISLLFLLALFFFCRSVKQIFISSTIIGGLFILFTPFVHDINWQSFLSEPLAAYFSMQTGSFFPLFPFTAYLFAGSAASALYLLWKKSNKTHLLGINYLLIALFLIATGLIFDALPIRIYPTYNYWKTSPNLFLFRIGCVLILWASFNQILKKVNRRVPRIIPILGQHTLSIYVAHVVLLYGCAWYIGLNYWIGKTFNPLQVLGVIGGIVACSMLLAYSLDYVKVNSRFVYRGLQLAAASGIVLLIVI